ncbi:nitrate- and nitrite sensing domain-containing protein [Cellulomonas denverensis]|uniref:nitrate- and nitrite sensing domain-containing protein n=1 Tax=Cellulomonas denverensis TaxID=264297 RepID=UPI0035E89F5B
MLRRLGIRAKVLAVLALPVLVLLVASAYIAVQSAAQARTAAAVSQVVQVLPDYAIAVEALQQERTISMQKAGDEPLSGNLNSSRGSTDRALAALAESIAGLDLSDLDFRVGEAIETATTKADLSSIRSQVDNETLPQSLVVSNYTDVIAAQNNVPALVAETLSDRSLGSRLTAYGQVATTIERVLRAQPTSVEVLLDDGADPEQVRELAGLFAVADDARTQARTTTNNLRLAGIQLPSRDADLAAMQLAIESGNPETIASVNSARWNALVNAELATLRPVGDDLLASASDQADRLAAEAQREALITVGITVAATALSIVIAFLVSRGIVIPLRRLTTAAGEVREELPRLVEQVAEPGKAPDLSLAEIPVTSRDEVGRLAAAFNSVNATTIQVARDQAALRGSIAEMFVNVARRDQVLLGRQLAFIDSLERSEEDPATLANLFRLDHLATRMRRNAESLLVLAGIDSGRRLREAMPLSDVVRTASSEIEQYDRVQLDLGADPLMHGFNALAAAHLMAELLENATLFSEPGTPVQVRTAERAGERSGDRQVLVTITDQGLGMSDDELAEANATIASAAATDAIGAQRLGLYVVARLAARLGAQVSLARVSDGGSGTVATVTFPGALFTAEPGTAGPLESAATGAMRRPSTPPGSPNRPPRCRSTWPPSPTAPPAPACPGGGPAVPSGPPSRSRSRMSCCPPPPRPPSPRRSPPPPPVGRPPSRRMPHRCPPVAPGCRAVARRGCRPAPPGTAADPAATESVPEGPAGPRAGLFAGFRGRGAVPEESAATAAAPVPDEPAEPVAAPVPEPDDAAGFSSRGDLPEEFAATVAENHAAGFVVPALMPDEDEPLVAGWGGPVPVESFGAVVDEGPAAEQDWLAAEPYPVPETSGAGTDGSAAGAVPGLVADGPGNDVPGVDATWDLPGVDAGSTADPEWGATESGARAQDVGPTAGSPAPEPAPGPQAAVPAEATRSEPPFHVPEPFAPIDAADAPAPARERRVEVPDFASVVRGDGTDEPPAPPRRERGAKARRPFFSFGRRRRPTEPRAVTGAHKLVTPPARRPRPPRRPPGPCHRPAVERVPVPTWAPQDTAPTTVQDWTPAGPAAQDPAAGSPEWASAGTPDWAAEPGLAGGGQWTATPPVGQAGAPAAEESWTPTPPVGPGAGAWASTARSDAEPGSWSRRLLSTVVSPRLLVALRPRRRPGLPTRLPRVPGHRPGSPGPWATSPATPGSWAADPAVPGSWAPGQEQAPRPSSPPRRRTGLVPGRRLGPGRARRGGRHPRRRCPPGSAARCRPRWRTPRRRPPPVSVVTSAPGPRRGPPAPMPNRRTVPHRSPRPAGRRSRPNPTSARVPSALRAPPPSRCEPTSRSRR